LGYPIGIIAIISLIMEKENRFVRFHALQSILLYVALLAIWMPWLCSASFLGVIGIAASAAGSAGGALSSIVGWSGRWSGWPIFLGALIAIIVGAVKAYGGNYFKIPIIGNMAEKFANK